MPKELFSSRPKPAEPKAGDDRGPTNGGTGGSVVLVSSDAADCSLLLRALSARGLPAVLVLDEPSVMAELARLSREGVERCVFIVVEPRRWERLGELVGAVQAYHGQVYCWQFAQQGGSAHLTELDGRFAGPVGQIRKRTRPVDRLLVKAPGREMTTREIVTQQELTMLLGPVPGEAG